jgi:hypothetical protein
MDKRHVFQTFGGAAELARLLGIRRQAVYAWPDELPQAQVDRLIGLAFRTGKLHILLPSSKLQDGVGAKEAHQ